MVGEPYLRERLQSALKKIGCDVNEDIEIILDRPKVVEHGDLASNLAMLLASKLKKNPRDIAGDLLANLDLDPEVIDRVEVAGAGFINFHVNDSFFRQSLLAIREQDTEYGRTDWGKRKKVQIEFVSANPTGPLNVVSARAATVGDVLANLFDAVGFAAEREYYVNDAGRQVLLLGRSVSSRYLHLLGQQEALPAEGYHGDYIVEIAKELVAEFGDELSYLPDTERWQKLARISLQRIMASQKAVLDAYGVHFDSWYHESELRNQNKHFAILQRLTENDYAYEQDGAKWFRSSDFGDEKDRVLVTSEGEPTYFLVDIAYHEDKYSRDFEMLYDLWGPDHHGYIDRMKAALQALGHPRDAFEVNIIQQVNLLQNGQVVKMSKRAGKLIEMEELLEEVGVDVARFFFVARRTQSPLDFDMDLAKDTTEDNPVFYVQYAHARICNIIKHANEQDIHLPETADYDLLHEEEEMALTKRLLQFPDVISNSAKYLEPHRIPNYLQELAATFHRFYHHHKVVSEDNALTSARLVLVECTRIVLANGLKLLGISAPERM
jgi:arginyl-tRNA synthetase